MNFSERRQTHFLMWVPAGVAAAPELVIGRLTHKNGAVTLMQQQTLPLRRSTAPGANSGDVWEIPAVECGLQNGHVYHYWFVVRDSNAYRADGDRALLRCTDPAATSVDWRLLGPAPPGYGDDDRQPAAVVRFVDGRLVPADPAHPLVTFEDQADVSQATLPPNNRLVIYELPTAWTRVGDQVSADRVGVGTFRDVTSLIDRQAPRGNFATVKALHPGRAHLLDLGINALELLPPADSFQDRSKWGYGTSNYFAPDFDLGRPAGQDAPTACADLLALVRACHRHGIRFIADVVMAFAQRSPLRHVDYLDYFVRFGADPRDPEQSDRDGFGGDLWKYGFFRPSYDPVTGTSWLNAPARQFHLAHLAHWMSFFHIDGVRLDSVNNIRNYDFVGAYRDEARRLWRQRWQAENDGQGEAGADADERFLVVGEELYRLAAARSHAPEIRAVGGDSGGGLLLRAEIRG